MGVEELLGNEALKARIAASQRHFAHSYLICGADGAGKHTLARWMAAAMQCGAAQGPCGICAACRKVAAGMHPDVIPVNDPAHKTIAVDVIRQMRADVFIRPNEGQRKIYILDQDMGEPAQNALLKILEEPPAYAVFLILTERAEKLLPTIRSRCAELRMAPLGRAEALAEMRRRVPGQTEAAYETAYLRSGGFLGQALRMLEGQPQPPQLAQFAACYAARDPLGLLELLLPMEKYKREQLIPILEALRAYLTELLLCRSGAARPDETAQRILKSRTGAELLAAANSLQTAIDDLNANVGTGAVIGWLSIQLR